MSGLIKADGAMRDVRSFAPSPPHGAEHTAPRRSPLEHALENAREEIARLETQLAEERIAAERDAVAAYEAGKAAGRSAADDGMRQKQDAIETALRAAQAGWAERLDGLDALAVHLARAVLARLFAQSDDFADFVTRAVALKLATLRAGSVVTLTVSAQDFPDETARAVLAAGSGAAIVADPALATGACRLDLTLGHIDLGIGALAGEVDAALAALTVAGAS